MRQPERAEFSLVDAVDVGTRLSSTLLDAVDVGHEARGLLVAAEIRVGQTECAQAGVGERAEFGWSMTDAVVLKKDDPAAFTRVPEPHRVLDVLASLLAVDGGEGVDLEACQAERLGDDDPS